MKGEKNEKKKLHKGAAFSIIDIWICTSEFSQRYK